MSPNQNVRPGNKRGLRGHYTPIKRKVDNVHILRHTLIASQYRRCPTDKLSMEHFTQFFGQLKVTVKTGIYGGEPILTRNTYCDCRNAMARNHAANH